jgi:hypothetical protein
MMAKLIKAPSKTKKKKKKVRDPLPIMALLMDNMLYF